jgi:hypothetical protein
VNGNGEQRGYFHNTHTNGDISQGTFEAKVITFGTAVVIDGNWKFTGGSGSLSGITGGGTFRSEMSSPTSWERLGAANTKSADAG